VRRSYQGLFFNNYKLLSASIALRFLQSIATNFVNKENVIAPGNKEICFSSSTFLLILSNYQTRVGYGANLRLQVRGIHPFSAIAFLLLSTFVNECSQARWNNPTTLGDQS
jgi:lipopolysaccharide export LptBFGC system permease protein LptF